MILLATFSFSASAIDNYHVECSNCLDDSQYVKVAKDNAINRQTIYVNVMNFDNYEMRKFRVYKNSKTVCDPNSREPDGEGGYIQDCWVERTLTADPVTLTSIESSTFIDFANSYNDFKKALKSSPLTVPDNVVPSAYNLIGASFLHTKVVDHFKSSNDPESVFIKATILAQSGTAIVEAGIKLNTPAIVFTFSDGSKAYALFRFYDGKDNYHLTFFLVIDKNGNQIELTDKVNPFPKFMDMNNIPLSSWQTLYEAFKAYGLAVPGSTSKIVPSGTVTIVDCANKVETVCRNPL